jgi:alkylation response protein AidB-like acyl-CoA dehydrogenase
MALIDLELDLSPEERAVRDTVHKFAAEVLRPAGEALDKLADPADVVAKDSILWDVFKKYRELGLGEFGGGVGGEELTPLQRARLGCITGEEIGWGDTGLGVSLGVAAFPGLLARMSGNPALIERFGGDDVIGCWAVTEPDHGSDMVDFGARVGTGERGRPNCIARKDGDSFVISGQKAAWVSNGTIATAAALFCGVDLGDGPKGCGVFVAPLDEGGVTRGKPLDKIGQRPLNQGEIFFDELRVPAEYMVVAPEGYQFAIETVLTMANGGMGTSFVGLARAALELAIDYAKERIQGGAPIFEHQSVKGRLFEMFRKVEAARALNRKVVLYNTVSAPGALHYAIASKVTSTQTAFEVSSAALQIFGGNGLSREYPIEKIMRDARASLIEDGCNEVLSLVGAGRL